MRRGGVEPAGADPFGLRHVLQSGEFREFGAARHQRPHPQALHFPMFLGGVAVDLAVPPAEIAAQDLEVERRGEGHFDGVALADIAHQGRALDDDGLAAMALSMERLHQGRQHAVVQGVEAGGIPGGAQHADGLLLRVAHVGHDAAQRGKGGGEARHDDLADAELARQPRRVQGTGAAEGEQGALAPVDAAFHRHARQRANHRGVGDLLDAEGQFDDADAELAGERRQCRFCRRDIERDGAAQAPARVEIAQDRVGVGDRRPRPAAPVGGGPGVGAGALGADRQASGAQRDQGAAAGADRFDGDHGLAHRPSGELGVGRDLRHAVHDQADVGRRAAHVEGQGLAESQRCRDMRGGGNAGRRSGQGHGERPSGGGLGRRHAARRMHDVQPGAAHLALQPLEIARGDRHHRRVQHGGRRAFELARLRIDLVRQRDEGNLRLQRSAQGAFVGGVGIGVQERDRDAFHAAGGGLPHRFGDRRRVGGQEGVARMVDPLGQSDPAFGGDLRGTTGRQVEPVEMLASGAADIQHVLETARRHQHHRLHPVLDDGVGDQRRAVDQIVDLARIEAGGRQGCLDAGDRIVALRRHLDRPELARRGQERHQVGEGAADVDADLPPGIGHDVSHLGRAL